MIHLRLASAFLLPAMLAGCANLFTWNPQPPLGPPPASPPSVVPERPPAAGEYVVQHGDTVYSIAFRNQLDYRELARWNQIGSDYLIRPGQVMRLGPPSYTVANSDIVVGSLDDEGGGKPMPITAAPRPITTPPPSPAGARPTPANIPSAGGKIWQWPTQGVVVRGFDPAHGSKGLDFTGNIGQPVYAASAGKVVYSGSALKGYGELIIIKHDDLHLSAYGYNRTRLVAEGDEVKAGQKIAELGMGPENKPVLHFEIRERGQPVDPVPYLPAKTAS
jgi:lipoprotein NlpD